MPLLLATEIASVPKVILLFLVLVGGGSGVGGWIGKSIALSRGEDPARRGDAGGVIGGMVGLCFAVGMIIGSIWG